MLNETIITLGDKSYFDTFIGKRILRKDLEKMKDSSDAIVPLFSANVYEPFGCVEVSNIDDFSSDYVLWGIDGNFNFSIQKAGNIFATTDHCGSIKIIDEGIYPLYLLYKLNIVKEKYAYSRTFRANLKNISKIEIGIPIDKNGKFDLEKQKEIAGKYEKLEKMKNRIRIMKEDIEDKQIKLSKIGKGEEVKICDVFELSRGKSIYTRNYGDLNRGDFPVYSAGREQLTSINTYDFDGEYLTWATNGFAGYLKKINGKFSLNADRGIFLFKREDVDINFVKYSIQSDLRNLTKGRIGDKGKNEFTKLSPKKIEENISIKIPIKENGKFDLEKQKEIAEKYEKIEKIKNNLLQELEYLEKVKVEI